MTERSRARRTRAHPIASWWLAVICWGVAGATSAASLQLAPTSITLHAGQQADGLWLTNSGSAPMQVQARVYRWTQRDGRDELQPTDELVISPPMRGLAAGEKQLLRVVRAVPPPQVETGYRVIVDELPGFDPGKTGTQFVLRYSVPIFLTPPQDQGGEPQPRLQARLLGDAQGQAVLEVRNDGAGHAQIADIAIGGGGPPRTVVAGLVGYVLPGQTMRWPLGRELGELNKERLLARINGEPAQSPLPMAATAP